MNDPATSQEAFLGLPGILFIGLYVASLLVVGWLGMRAKKENTLSDFYLGGRNLGFMVLLFTMFATQYSGNTLMGYPGKAYRSGFQMLFAVAAMVTVTAVLFVYAPRLRRLSAKKGYITPGDFVQDRFGNRPLTVMVTLLGILALINYLITNLKVLGLVVENVTGGAIGFESSVIVLAIVMIAYESMGGMRSVAWTDVTQGTILFIGVLLLFGAAMITYGGTESMTTTLEKHRPELWVLPDFRLLTTWLGTVILLGLGNALYPHTVQRIYAARSDRALQRSLQIMVFMPLFTSFLMILIGLMAAARFPGLDAVGSDQAIMFILRDLATYSTLMNVVGVVFIAAVIAATMSTIDSALLSMSAMVTADLYRPLRPDTPQDRLTRFGKFAAVGVMAAAVLLTIWLKDKTIFSIIVFKHELLIQLAPALMIGVHWKKLTAVPVLTGMVVGTTTAVLMTLGMLGPVTKPLGLHAGVWGLFVNLTLLFGLQLLMSKRAATSHE
jgi:SSS family solute:Na+ symporter